jgi:hypothetical protein
MTRDDELAHMRLGEALRWAADDDGYLRWQKRLIRVALARGYKPGWVHHVYGEHWREVWERCVRWRKEQQDFYEG